MLSSIVTSGKACKSGVKVQRSTEKFGIREVKNGERTSDCKKESG